MDQFPTTITLQSARRLFLRDQMNQEMKSDLFVHMANYFVKSLPESCKKLTIVCECSKHPIRPRLSFVDHSLAAVFLSWTYSQRNHDSIDPDSTYPYSSSPQSYSALPTENQPHCSCCPLPREGLLQLFHAFPVANIKTISLSLCPHLNIDDDLITSISSMLNTRLTALCIQPEKPEYDNLTDQGLFILGSNALCLKRLILVQCNHITQFQQKTSAVPQITSGNPDVVFSLDQLASKSSLGTDMAFDISKQPTGKRRFQDVSIQSYSDSPVPSDSPIRLPLHTEYRPNMMRDELDLEAFSSSIPVPSAPRMPTLANPMFSSGSTLSLDSPTLPQPHMFNRATSPSFRPNPQFNTLPLSGHHPKQKKKQSKAAAPTRHWGMLVHVEIVDCSQFGTDGLRSLLNLPAIESIAIRSTIQNITTDLYTQTPHYPLFTDEAVEDLALRLRSDHERFNLNSSLSSINRRVSPNYESLSLSSDDMSHQRYDPPGAPRLPRRTKGQQRSQTGRTQLDSPSVFSSSSHAPRVQLPSRIQSEDGRLLDPSEPALLHPAPCRSADLDIERQINGTSPDGMTDMERAGIGISALFPPLISQDSSFQPLPSLTGNHTSDLPPREIHQLLEPLDSTDTLLNPRAVINSGGMDYSRNSASPNFPPYPPAQPPFKRTNSPFSQPPIPNIQPKLTGAPPLIMPSTSNHFRSTTNSLSPSSLSDGGRPSRVDHPPPVSAPHPSVNLPTYIPRRPDRDNHAQTHPPEHTPPQRVGSLSPKATRQPSNQNLMERNKSVACLPREHLFQEQSFNNFHSMQGDYHADVSRAHNRPHNSGIHPPMPTPAFITKDSYGIEKDEPEIEHVMDTLPALEPSSSLIREASGIFSPDSGMHGTTRYPIINVAMSTPEHNRTDFESQLRTPSTGPGLFAQPVTPSIPRCKKRPFTWPKKPQQRTRSSSTRDQDSAIDPLISPGVDVLPHEMTPPQNRSLSPRTPCVTRPSLHMRTHPEFDNDADWGGSDTGMGSNSSEQIRSRRVKRTHGQISSRSRIRPISTQAAGGKADLPIQDGTPVMNKEYLYTLFKMSRPSEDHTPTVNRYTSKHITTSHSFTSPRTSATPLKHFPKPFASLPLNAFRQSSSKLSRTDTVPVEATPSSAQTLRSSTSLKSSFSPPEPLGFRRSTSSFSSFRRDEPSAPADTPAEAQRGQKRGRAEMNQMISEFEHQSRQSHPRGSLLSSPRLSHSGADFSQLEQFDGAAKPTSNPFAIFQQPDAGKANFDTHRTPHISQRALNDHFNDDTFRKRTGRLRVEGHEGHPTMQDVQPAPSAITPFTTLETLSPISESPKLSTMPPSSPTAGTSIPILDISHLLQPYPTVHILRPRKRVEGEKNDIGIVKAVPIDAFDKSNVRSTNPTDSRIRSLNVGLANGAQTSSVHWKRIVPTDIDSLAPTLSAGSKDGTIQGISDLTDLFSNMSVSFGNGRQQNTQTTLPISTVDSPPPLRTIPSGSSGNLNRIKPEPVCAVSSPIVPRGRAGLGGSRTALTADPPDIISMMPPREESVKPGSMFGIIPTPSVRTQLSLSQPLDRAFYTVPLSLNPLTAENDPNPVPPPIGGAISSTDAGGIFPAHGLSTLQIIGQTFSLSNTFCRHIARIFKNLTRLELGCGSRISDDGVKILAKELSSLKVVNLSYSQISSNGVNSLLIRCSKLSTLICQNCPQIHKEQLLPSICSEERKLESLVLLDVSFCRPIDDAFSSTSPRRGMPLVRISLNSKLIEKLKAIAAKYLNHDARNYINQAAHQTSFSEASQTSFESEPGSPNPSDIFSTQSYLNELQKLNECIACFPSLCCLLSMNEKCFFSVAVPQIFAELVAYALLEPYPQEY
ncbi:hypothetical protein BLNAU_15778 [Blattamonas nauphoetae]|uniref:Uncharacterized protein n=1 Tax=Blattamonas nauphoetae TaxID=2049346 RepID=A0ABQ9X9S5_9EUKA|nr:hypothetical protein BLNAU_15778 [Blattamonas nauphoetae]